MQRRARSTYTMESGNPGLNPGSVVFTTKELSAYLGISHSELQFTYV